MYVCMYICMYVCTFIWWIDMAPRPMLARFCDAPKNAPFKSAAQPCRAQLVDSPLCSSIDGVLPGAPCRLMLERLGWGHEHSQDQGARRGNRQEICGAGVCTGTSYTRIPDADYRRVTSQISGEGLRGGRIRPRGCVCVYVGLSGLSPSPTVDRTSLSCAWLASWLDHESANKCSKSILSAGWLGPREVQASPCKVVKNW